MGCWGKTYRLPTLKTMVRLNFFLADILSPRSWGMGRNKMRKSKTTEKTPPAMTTLLKFMHLAFGDLVHTPSSFEC